MAAIIFSAYLATSQVNASELQPTLRNNSPSPSVMPNKKKSAVRQIPDVVATNSRFLANGTYLYGETSQPGRLNSEYVVFENHNGKVFGAVYLSNSEFNCFHGEVHPGQLSMMVVDSYANEAHPYAVNLETGNPDTINAEYRQVEEISKQDLNLLELCRQMYQRSNWKAVIRG